MALRWTSGSVTPPRLLLALSMVAVAAAAGTGVHILSGKNSVGPKVPTDIVLLSAGGDSLPAIWLEAPQPLPERPVLPDLFALDAPAPAPAATPAAPNCARDLALDLLPDAMMAVSLLAPCAAGERVVLRHAGLAVTGRLDAQGRLATTFPALQTEAHLEIGFADGTRVKGLLQVDEALATRRFGVQWQGTEAFALHSFENGADFGQSGHVSPAQRGVAEGGALAVLGDATVELPLLAQIYTYPVDAMPVEVLLEAAVTADTCGQDLLGEVITAEAGQVQITELTLAMPDCSALGDFLVLKNLPAEMKLAAN